nr:O-antigen ligase family protein [uncultured Allomuricauda sp.]
MKKILEYRHWLLCLVVFTIPMYTRLNNILLTAYVVLGILAFVANPNSNSPKNVSRYWPVFVFFILAVIGAFYGTNFTNGFKYLERYWSFLLVPLILSTEKYNDYDKRNQIFEFLVLGCAVTLLICYGNLIYEMIRGKEPLNYFYRWRHVGYEFTKIADTHPTYLGLFTVTSIAYLVEQRKEKGFLKDSIVLFLLLGLFQMASRMALLLLLIFSVYFLIRNFKKYRTQVFLIFFGIIAFTGLFKKYSSDYVQQRLFSKEAFFEDKRLDRWEASYLIFRENPFFGVGLANIEQARNDKYMELGFEQAAKSDLNAHNQLLEFLGRNGIVGGFFYVCSLGFLLILGIKRKDVIFTFIFFALILINFTESTMIRIKGIEFFAVFASLFLYGLEPSKNEKNENLHYPRL